MSCPLKKRKVVLPLVIPGQGQFLTHTPLQNNIKEAWHNHKSFTSEDVRIQSCPFRFGEIDKFVDGDSVSEFVDKFRSFPFAEKASDLFQFKQSLDLKTYVDPHVHSILEYLSTKVLTFLKNVTGLPLNDHIDLFLSDYQQTDFLLCHDDELDSRRIAFILYLTEDWKPEFGGNLDLFSSTDQMHPDKIVTSITPEFNKFLFFEVGPTSFHQVSEVVEEKVSRLALSGWFYGEPLPRPNIQFPVDQGYFLKDSITKIAKIFPKFCSESYMNAETCSDINEQLTEESQVLIPAFLIDSVYSAICSDIVDKDVSESLFHPVGPPNISSYQETAKGPLPQSQSADPTLQGLRQFFHSSDFLKFLETITEFPFTSCPITKVRSSLRKYSRGSYSLMRSGGKKQTGEVILQEQVEDEDEDEDPSYVDVTFYFASKWREDWGGLTIYSTTDGEQLIRIPPEGNCLTIVVRTPSVNSYVNYVNCQAKDEVYFSYQMTFAFNGTL